MSSNHRVRPDLPTTIWVTLFAREKERSSSATLLPGNGDRLALKLLREPQRVGDAVALDLAQLLAAARLDVNRGPGRMEPVGKALGIADEAGGARVFADANKQTFACGPGAGDGVRPHMGQKLLVHPLRGAAKRKLAQAPSGCRARNNA